MSRSIAVNWCLLCVWATKFCHSDSLPRAQCKTESSWTPRRYAGREGVSKHVVGVAWIDGRQRTKKSSHSARWSNSAPLSRQNRLRLISDAWIRISKGWKTNTNSNLKFEVRKSELRLTTLFCNKQTVKQRKKCLDVAPGKSISIADFTAADGTSTSKPPGKKKARTSGTQAAASNSANTDDRDSSSEDEDVEPDTSRDSSSRSSEEEEEESDDSDSSSSNSENDDDEPVDADQSGAAAGTSGEQNVGETGVSTGSGLEIVLL